MFKRRQSPPKKEVKTLAGILGTNDHQAQIKTAEALLRPVVPMTIVMDFRTGRVAVNVTGTVVDYETAYAVLDAAREYLRQSELAGTANQAIQASQKAPEPKP